MKNKYKIVLAGSNRQFLDFLRSNVSPKNWDNFIYADFPEKIMGIEADEIIEYGTYYENPNYYRIKELAKSRITIAPEKIG